MAPRRRVTLSVILVLLVGFGLTGATCSEIYTRNGTWYRVQEGDTLSGIARRFGTTTQYVAEMNNVTDSSQLRAGQRIYIPNDRAHYAARSPRGPTRTKPRTRSQGNPDQVTVQRDKFRWPISGRVTSGFGMRGTRRHDGIDISAARGAPVHAAESGEVAFSSRLRGYGNLILVKHPDNFFTVYAHNSRNLKKKGERVKKGEVIARVGTTGRSTGPHLHFEVRRGSQARNPLFYLPKQPSQLAQEGRLGSGGR